MLTVIIVICRLSFIVLVVKEKGGSVGVGWGGLKRERVGINKLLPLNMGLVREGRLNRGFILLQLNKNMLNEICHYMCIMCSN